MDKFREALEGCQLQDLGFKGDPFSWRNNCNVASNYIKERLDRAVATKEWCAHFPAFRVINGDPRHSDHRLVIWNWRMIEVTEEEGQGPVPSGSKPTGWRRKVVAKW
jgi:hypothetical protein